MLWTAPPPGTRVPRKWGLSAFASHLENRCGLGDLRYVHRNRQLAKAVAKSKRLAVADYILPSGLRDERLFELPALVRCHFLRCLVGVIGNFEIPRDRGRLVHLLPVQVFLGLRHRKTPSRSGQSM